MIDILPLLAIVGTTLFMMAAGTLWYSDVFLGKYWMANVGLSEADRVLQQKHLLRNIALTFFSYVALVSCVVLVGYLFQKSNVSPYYAALLIWLVIAAVQLQSVLWESRSVVYLLISLGFYAIISIGGLLMVTHWPW